MKFELNIESKENTIALAKELASQLEIGDIICLKGDLGAGKTFFARYLIKHFLKSDIEVTSPTFQLLQNYDKVDHYDLYRLNSPDEIYELGIDDSLNGSRIVIIEWPEIIRHLLPQNTIDIEILIDGNDRQYIIQDNNERIKL